MTSKTTEDKEITNRYKDLLKDTYQRLSDKDIKLIRKAFELAVDAHKEQRRKSGEPFIFHPIAVAKIVAYEIGLGANAIATALLHDVVEDSDYTIKDVEKIFGSGIAKNVEGLTKISKISKSGKKTTQVENIKKIILTLNQDPIVILVKIADRLHNMRTMRAMPTHKQKRVANETLYIYTPLSHRLGLSKIKNELEDLGLKYVNKIVYQDIKGRIKNDNEGRKMLDDFCSRIHKILEQNKIQASVTSRTKSVYSIHQKMISKNISFDEVYDRFAMRIVYEGAEKAVGDFALKIYQIISKNYKVHPMRTRDWISMPKNTGYQALHMTVMDSKHGQWIEVQIRSKKMNEIAERGAAAHEKYKRKNKNKIFEKDEKIYQGAIADWLDEVKELLNSEDGDSIEFINDFKLSLYKEDIFVFTHKGELIRLPRKAGVLDFAFAIHTDIGCKARSAKVNNKIVPLSNELKSGDQIEIMTANNDQVKRNWLNLVITAKAKSSIRRSLKEKDKAYIEEGEKILARKLKVADIKLNNKIYDKLLSYFNIEKKDDLLYSVSNNIIDNDRLRDFIYSLNNRLTNFFIRRNKEKIPSLTDESPIHFEDGKNHKHHLAECCNPIVGDEIFGVLEHKTNSIAIHRNNCINSIQLQTNHAGELFNLRWKNTNLFNALIELMVKGEDRFGILNEILLILIQEKLVIEKVAFKAHEGVFSGVMDIKINNRSHLNEIRERIINVMGVTDVSISNQNALKR